MSNYYLHRISYSENISVPLLEKGNYLSIGFGSLYDNKLHDITDKKEFKKYIMANNSKIKNANSLWKFLNFKKGDLILVPSPKKFSIYKIVGDNFVGNDDKELSEAIAKLKLNNFKEDGKNYILGFFWKVEPITTKPISRSKYADALLTRRMHFRGTNVSCNDIKDSIDKLINCRLCFIM